MGLTKEQWDACSPKQQAEYTARQHELDRHEREKQAQLRAAHQQRMQRQREQKERETEARYDNAHYGDIAQVNIEGGYLTYYQKRYEYHPVSFVIVRGESKTITVTRKGRTTQQVEFPVRLSDDGGTLFFDDGDHDQQVFTNLDWERGQSYRTDSSVAHYNFGLVGATVHIRYKQSGKMPIRITVDQR